MEAGEAHDCRTTTEAALTEDLADELRDAWKRLRETAASFGDQRIARPCSDGSGLRPAADDQVVSRWAATPVRDRRHTRRQRVGVLAERGRLVGAHAGVRRRGAAGGNDWRENMIE